MTALTISARTSANSRPAKSSASSEMTREALRSVSIRNRKESAGGRLRRTSTGGSTTVSRVGAAWVGGSGYLVGASATVSEGVNGRRRAMSREFLRSRWVSTRQRTGARGVERALQALTQLHGRFPAQQLARERDVGLADL